MNIYIPYSPQNPKTRLAPLMSKDERLGLSHAMLEDVHNTISAAGQTPIVLTTEPIDVEIETIISTEPLSTAINSILSPDKNQLQREINRFELPIGVVMADVGLVTTDALSELFSSNTSLTLAPGLRGGTNAFVTRSLDFYVDYHGISYLDHRRIAREQGIKVTTVDSFRLACDINEPDDLVDLITHGTGRAREYIVDRFEIVDERGTNSVRRITDHT